ncbi:hypothetical protein EMEDMD4_510036 [Sinorhizobium medicae]|uniref:Uncharacterized protein n=1 Tax=Sinorhizobium medicae TaxID=110321 RepID=A0A508X1N8_9HYPH|nr:hypothetical protein EMEDMD4_510036 [Sinorhizobium medicae]
MGSAFLLATLWAALRGFLDLVGEARLYLHRRLFLFRFPRLAVASHLSFSHGFDPFGIAIDASRPAMRRGPSRFRHQACAQMRRSSSTV